MKSKSDITYDEIGGVRAFAYGENKKSIEFHQIDSTEATFVTFRASIVTYMGYVELLAITHVDTLPYIFVNLDNFFVIL